MFVSRRTAASKSSSSSFGVTTELNGGTFGCPFSFQRLVLAAAAEAEVNVIALVITGQATRGSKCAAGLGDDHADLVLAKPPLIPGPDPVDRRQAIG